MKKLLYSALFALTLCLPSAAWAQCTGVFGANTVCGSVGGGLPTSILMSSVSIAVGTSPISGGTTTRVLYDNAGILGEYTNTQLTALINPATAALSGALPAFPNTTSTFFRGDGTYQTLNCSALTNGATGCSTATGTSGATIPLLNGTNTWSAVQSFNSGDLSLNGSSTGALVIRPAAAAGASTLTLPGGTTDFSATGGTHNVVQQSSTGAAFTVGQLASTDISGLGTAATVNTGTSGATIPLLNGANTYSGTSTFSAQIISTFGTPTISSGACGTGTNGSVSGTNQSGKITIGAAATTTCTVSFSTTITAPNACVIFPANAAAAATGTTVAFVSSVGTTNFVVTGTALASTAYYYTCL